MNLSQLWAPIRFVGHKTQDLKDKVNERIVSMNEDVFGKESTLKTIVKENLAKKDKKQ